MSDANAHQFDSDPGPAGDNNSKSALMKLLRLITSLFVLCAGIGAGQDDPPVRDAVRASLDKEIPSLLELYKHLHANPELSLHEEKSSARVAEELEKSGYKVTTHVGGFGLVGVLSNGPGPTVLVR